MKYLSLVAALLVGINFSLQAVPSLSRFNFIGASVIPYTHFGPKKKKHVILAREAEGRDKGTYDAFGGKKDRNEFHPVITASRELSEETVRLLGTPTQLKRHLGVTVGNTLTIIANIQKKFVVYITCFNFNTLRSFTNRFYKARALASYPKFKEKDKLAWVKLKDLKKSIASAKHDQFGRILPVKVRAVVIDSPGKQHTERITLRPIFAKSLQSYFQNKSNFLVGKDKRIRFYTR